MRLSAVAWDSHAHVIENPARYPLSPGRTYDPPLAPLDAYLAMLDRHGIAHGVLVQPSVYSYDNSCMLDALDRAGGRLFGVAVPAPDASPEDLEEMHRRGVRGVRCNLLNPGGLAPEMVMPWQPLLRELGWHVAFHIAAETVDELGEYLGRFSVPVVIDHMGRPDRGAVISAIPRLKRLIELVREGRCFVKLSAPYRLSAARPPWRDVTPLARALVAANSAACLWATDWPHTDTPRSASVKDLLDALDDWCPDARTQQIVLAEAPRRLLGLDGAE